MAKARKQREMDCGNKPSGNPRVTIGKMELSDVRFFNTGHVFKLSKDLLNKIKSTGLR